MVFVVFISLLHSSVIISVHVNAQTAYLCVVLFNYTFPVLNGTKQLP